MKIGIMQGDQYPLAFMLKDESGTVINEAIASTVEITLCGITKICEYDSTTQSWLYPLTQAETLALGAGNYGRAVVRIAVADEDAVEETEYVYGSNAPEIVIIPSKSKAVL